MPSGNEERERKRAQESKASGLRAAAPLSSSLSLARTHIGGSTKEKRTLLSGSAFVPTSARARSSQREGIRRYLLLLLPPKKKKIGEGRRNREAPLLLSYFFRQRRKLDRAAPVYSLPPKPRARELTVQPRKGKGELFFCVRASFPGRK